MIDRFYFYIIRLWIFVTFLFTQILRNPSWLTISNASNRPYYLHTTNHVIKYKILSLVVFKSERFPWNDPQLVSWTVLLVAICEPQKYQTSILTFLHTKELRQNAPSGINLVTATTQLTSYSGRKLEVI